VASRTRGACATDVSRELSPNPGPDAGSASDTIVGVQLGVHNVRKIRSLPVTRRLQQLVDSVDRTPQVTRLQVRVPPGHHRCRVTQDVLDLVHPGSSCKTNGVKGSVRDAGVVHRLPGSTRRGAYVPFLRLLVLPLPQSGISSSGTSGSCGAGGSPEAGGSVTCCSRFPSTCTRRAVTSVVYRFTPSRSVQSRVRMDPLTKTRAAVRASAGSGTRGTRRRSGPARPSRHRKAAIAS